MRRAIAISAQGLGSTSPNPPVGCVVLDVRGRTVGEGYHLRKGEPHAEVNALAAAGRSAEGGTAVVTLEPCNHYGRTPPCREALLAARVARVLIAVMDPTSRGAGGAAVLRQAGVEVEQDVLADEALVVLGPWLSATKTGRPHVTWVYQAALDGSPVGEGEAVRNEVAALRGAYDLVVTAGGAFDEGRPGSHGRDVFAVLRGDAVPGSPEALFAAGARSVLVAGHSPGAAALLAACLPDEVIVHVPGTAESWAPSPEAGPVGVLPDGYRVTSVAPAGNGVRVTGTRG
ncbi:bifunctional diaminohydroxyphosphoribosylaminopyrimidine deaminase/5-amino-6-(5-phosphoribosylamino)uracil reductase RibD [Streptomyces sp. NRRL F-5123]|uniref:bifunctional diaminohydroxyphosphoribosylaminopyrimidine deaminase/5-amino-6-(5-phosphoribosylamino)uracil reductase RibD n=1 Tax=Streptomyces sp. NRRL F-5123 TaxID=1463856 RepID=UPI001F022865|nr:bifunctional diaminohydroxyphosphoribosylaminopyrimidine deaminase/5-amino-6-(5-phosphoribosylamino)uracil reductase RibD [Streptomyces sp. NRRL F-5123]